MKRIIIISVAILISSCVYSQTDSSQNKRKNQNNATNSNAHRDMQNSGDKGRSDASMDKSSRDGIIMKDGKLMMMTNGKTSNMENDMTLSNGTTVMSNGTIIKSDGTKMTMKEGQYIDMSGNMAPMKKSAATTGENNVKSSTNKDMYTAPDSTRNKMK